jgi:hypothetical protein
MQDFDNSFLTENDHPAVHEDAFVFEIKGQAIGWRASGLALKRASDQGVEVGELLADVQQVFSAADLDEEDIEEMSEEEMGEVLMESGGVAYVLDVAATVIWIGALHFNANVRQEAVLSILDFSMLGDLPINEMVSRIFPEIEDEEETAGKETEEDSES